jgi:hypothetical protein
MRSFLELVEATEDTPVDLVTIEDVKLELDITSDAEDEKIEAGITRVSKMIAEECNRVFGLSRGTETFAFDTGETTRPGQKLALSLYPVTEVETLTLNGSEVEDYSLDKERGLIWIEGVSWSGTAVVEYEGGYDLPDNGPAKLQAAVIEEIRQRRAVSTSDPTVQSTAHGDTRVSFFNQTKEGVGGLSRGTLDLVQSFKRLAIA